MSKSYIIAVRSSRLFIKGAAIREHDKKKMPYFTTEPAMAISFEDEPTAKDYLDKLVSGNRSFRIEQFG
jgi:wyosine [tRNA(Phe)-imidazoG37] synthetase (radical SAM superfamily)